LRAIKSFSLGFGMVAIPVKLAASTDDKSKQLRSNIHQVHEECQTRIEQPKWCPKCDVRLGKDDVIKGYFMDDERFVPLTKEDLDNLPLESSRNINVEAFIKEGLEDPRWFETPYFLYPDEPGTKAFVLFTKAMENLGVTAIARVSIREHEKLCAIRPFNGLLLLHTLHWGDELRDYGEVIPFASVSDKEMELATALITGMTHPADLTSFTDRYREALIELVQAKLEGKTVEAPKARKPEANLESALLASLGVLNQQEKVEAAS